MGVQPTEAMDRNALIALNAKIMIYGIAKSFSIYYEILV